tara:strand:+ start:38 stop:484 length:447 start_codon:yes stop_codon:yes gene_type:complete
MAIFYGSTELSKPVTRMVTSSFSADITSLSYQAVTGHSVTLTPQSTSCKFLVVMETHGTMTTGSSNGQFEINRYKHSSASTTQIHVGSAYANPGGIRSLMPMFSLFFDQPSTTEQLTYSVNFRKYNGGGLGTANFGVNGTITVFELES